LHGGFANGMGWDEIVSVEDGWLVRLSGQFSRFVGPRRAGRDGVFFLHVCKEILALVELNVFAS
jgi:hypothetical protein